MKLARSDLALVPLPVGGSPDSDDAGLLEHLDRQVHDAITGLWRPGQPAPTAVYVGPVTWTVAGSAADLDGVPTHPACASCTELLQATGVYLLAHPGRQVAVAEVRWVEVWPDPN